MRLDEINEGMEVGPFLESVMWKELRMRSSLSFGNFSICLKQQREGIMVKMHEPGGKEEKVWCNDDHSTD